MSDEQPISYNRETAAADLFVHQIALNAIASLITPNESAQVTRQLNEFFANHIASLMRIYWDNQEYTVVPLVAARLQQIIDKLDTAENLLAVARIVAEMSHVHTSNGGAAHQSG